MYFEGLQDLTHDELVYSELLLVWLFLVRLVEVAAVSD
jgi:hypothetical protein